MALADNAGENLTYDQLGISDQAFNQVISELKINDGSIKPGASSVLYSPVDTTRLPKPTQVAQRFDAPTHDAGADDPVTYTAPFFGNPLDDLTYQAVEPALNIKEFADQLAGQLQLRGVGLAQKVISGEIQHILAGNEPTDKYNQIKPQLLICESLKGDEKKDLRQNAQVVLRFREGIKAEPGQQQTALKNLKAALENSNLGTQAKSSIETAANKAPTGPLLNRVNAKQAANRRANIVKNNRAGNEDPASKDNKENQAINHDYVNVTPPSGPSRTSSA